MQTERSRSIRHSREEAVEVIGASKWRTFIGHVLPNIMPVVIIVLPHGTYP